MTEQNNERDAIIEDALKADIEKLWASIHAWAFLGQESERELIDEIKDNFAKLQASRHQSNNVPVAWLHIQGDYKEASMRELDDDEVAMGWFQKPLYTSPQQTNALEMAAKVCSIITGQVTGHDIDFTTFKAFKDLTTKPESVGK